MSKPPQLPSTARPAYSFTPMQRNNNYVRQGALQPKAAHLQAAQPRAAQPKAASVPHRNPASPARPTAAQPNAQKPSHAAQSAQRGTTRTVQPKMNSAAPPAAAPSRTVGCAPRGIVQASIVGGAQAFQARANVLNAAPKQSPTASLRPSPIPARPSVQTAAKQSPTLNRPVKPATVQPKGKPGVNAFKVPLQPKSGGQPLPDQVRAKMEAALGADFSDVRVHVGREASTIGAIAYTWGTNIHFAPGQYNPFSIQGQKLLGHELWHVVQQKSGRVSNPLGGGVAVVQDHSLEAEADRMGIKAALTPTPRTSEK